MIDTVQLAKKAIILRREGKSYSDIASLLDVSRSSAANWVKNVRLTEDEKKLLHKNQTIKIQRSRLTASISLRARKVFKEKKAYEDAERDFKKNLKDPLFSLGLGLYWAKGSLGTGVLQFVHSDLPTLQLMLAWMDTYLAVPKKSLKYRVFCSVSEKSQEYEQFWSKNLGISPENFHKTVHAKNPPKQKKTNENKGSLAIIISKIDAIRLIIAWQKLFIRYYS